MDYSKTFKDLQAWQKAHSFVLAVYKVTKSFPNDEIYGLTSQFRRAAVSVPANIAEGYKKLSNADKLRFYNIAQGSLEECRYYVILSFDLEYISLSDQMILNELLDDTSRLLNYYCRSIVDQKIKTLKDNL